MGVHPPLHSYNQDIEWKAVRRLPTKCDTHPVRACTKHSSSWWQPGPNNRVHISGENFHSGVDIHNAIDTAKAEAEARNRVENEDKNKYMTFEVTNGVSKFGESYYVVGNVPELGNWDVQSAIKLECVAYPTWRAENVLIHDDKQDHSVC